MNEEKQIEKMSFNEVDLMAQDINRHCADLAENYCGEINCLTCLAHELIDQGWRNEALVLVECFEKIEKRFASLEYRANTSRKTVSVEELIAQVNWILYEVVPKTISELKQEMLGGYDG